MPPRGRKAAGKSTRTFNKTTLPKPAAVDNVVSPKRKRKNETQSQLMFYPSQKVVSHKRSRAVRAQTDFIYPDVVASRRKRTDKSDTESQCSTPKTPKNSRPNRQVRSPTPPPKASRNTRKRHISSQNDPPSSDTRINQISSDLHSNSSYVPTDIDSISSSDDCDVTIVSKSKLDIHDIRTSDSDPEELIPNAGNLEKHQKFLVQPKINKPQSSISEPEIISKQKSTQKTLILNREPAFSTLSDTDDNESRPPDTLPDLTRSKQKSTGRKQLFSEQPKNFDPNQPSTSAFVVHSPRTPRKTPRKSKNFTTPTTKKNKGTPSQIKRTVPLTDQFSDIESLDSPLPPGKSQIYLLTLLSNNKCYIYMLNFVILINIYESIQINETHSL